VTFDEYGVSGHANHIATAEGVQRGVRLLRAETPSLHFQAMKLQSKNVVRKFLGILDVLLSILVDDAVVINRAPWLVPQALARHQSQNALYRQAFVFFSSFTYINSLSDISS
jgi:N-acetylglucosaminylphosphatidylinositol deacetylase